eukprot:5806806-Prymnesium_polylepis.1
MPPPPKTARPASVRQRERLERERAPAYVHTPAPPASQPGRSPAAPVSLYFKAILDADSSGGIHHQTSSNIIKHHQTSSNLIKHHGEPAGNGASAAWAQVLYLKS